MIPRKSFIILGGLEIVLFALLGLIAAQSSFSSSSNTAVPTTVEAKPDDELIVAMPVTAIPDSGICKITYLERARGEYAPAALDLDSRLSDYYPVLDGLKEGELVAVCGNFLLDSQFQISSPSSLFYKHGQTPAAGHKHGAAGDKQAPVPKPIGHEDYAKASRAQAVMMGANISKTEHSLERAQNQTYHLRHQP